MISSVCRLPWMEDIWLYQYFNRYNWELKKKKQINNIRVLNQLFPISIPVEITNQNQTIYLVCSRHPAICYHHKSAHSHRPFITHPAFINHILTTLRSISLYRMIDQQILIWWIPRNRPFLFKHVFDLQNMYSYLCRQSKAYISIYPHPHPQYIYIQKKIVR